MTEDGATGDRDQAAAHPARVEVEPVLPLLPRFLCIFVPWALVVAGRPICLVAQRVPPLVWLVRLVARQLAARR